LRFKDKVVLVTGSSRGIGKSMALAFAREGADVVVAAKTTVPDPRIPGTIQETVREIEATGRRALGVQVDLRRDDQIDALVARTMETFGRVDILVNNAGTVYFGDVAGWTPKRFDLVMSVNVRATFLLSHALLPQMRERGGGTIVMISPPVRARAAAGKAPYLISKAGMTMLALAIAEEESSRHIASFALWPVTAVETAATINFQMGDRTMWRTPEVVSDALLALCARPIERCTGRAWLDEEVLREEGVTDFSHYRCDPDHEPPPLSIQLVDPEYAPGEGS
jgi:citronellol/citronellal dehydrogenase